MGAGVKVGYRYQSGAGNLWDVIEFLPDNRVRVELVATGQRFVWHIDSTGDLVELYRVA